MWVIEDFALVETSCRILGALVERHKKFLKADQYNRSICFDYFPELEKYYSQRFTYFTRYDEGVMLDQESWYSVTPERIAKEQTNIYIADVEEPCVVIDCFCGAGGNTIQFALHPKVKRVISIDIDPVKLYLARNNTSIYKCSDKITFIEGDFFKVVGDDAFWEPLKDENVKIFLSPPWGGPSYRDQKMFDVETALFDGAGLGCAMDYLSHCYSIMVFLPKNSKRESLLKIGNAYGYETDFIMNYSTSGKSKGLTVYYQKYPE